VISGCFSIRVRPNEERYGVRRVRRREAISGESRMYRLLLRVEERTWVPEPALTRARCQVGSRGVEGEVVVVVGGWADSPARRRSWVHSVGDKKLSIMAAKWFL
jgi:hypothetical protein